MIKKRQSKQVETIEQNKKVVQKQKIQNNSKPLEFKTYREEAIYVLNLLEKQGIDIYEEGRYGGMYLNRHTGGKFNHIFSDTNKNKKQLQSQVNNNEISNNDLSKLFGSNK